VEKYLLICEQLGEEPDPERMPLDHSELPAAVQVAFFIFNMLPDNYVGMDGVYIGKNWETCEFLCRTYQVQEIPTTLAIMKMYEEIIVEDRLSTRENEMKKAERQAKASSGKNLTHNVQG
jgi:hypothetical protein